MSYTGAYSESQGSKWWWTARMLLPFLLAGVAYVVPWEKHLFKKTPAPASLKSEPVVESNQLYVRILRNEEIARELTEKFSVRYPHISVSTSGFVELPDQYLIFKNRIPATGENLSGHTLSPEMKSACEFMRETEDGRTLLALARQRKLYIHGDPIVAVKSSFAPGLIREYFNPIAQATRDANKTLSENRKLLNILAFPGAKGFLTLTGIGMNPVDGITNGLMGITSLSDEQLRESLHKILRGHGAIDTASCFAEIQHDLSLRYTRDKHVKTLKEILNIFPAAMQDVVMATLSLAGQKTIEEHVDAVRAMNSLGDKGVYYFDLLQKIPEASMVEAACGLRNEFSRVAAPELAKKIWKGFSGAQVKDIIIHTLGFAVNADEAIALNSFTDIDPALSQNFAKTTRNTLERISSVVEKEKIHPGAPLRKLAQDIRTSTPH